jgi:SAM-dependent methyltransferase
MGFEFDVFFWQSRQHSFCRKRDTRMLREWLRMRRKRIEVSRSNPAQRWRDGVTDEIKFWEEYLETKGLRWPDQYRARLAPDTPLQPELTELLQPVQDRELRLLDIGAGPLTVLGKRMDDRVVSIVATDALGEEYEKLLERYGLHPPVRTIACMGEKLLDLFPRNYFHLVYARNSLDHSLDPPLIIRSAIQLARADGCVVLRHHSREAEKAAYYGLHQWNFDLRDGKTLLWRPGTEYHLEQELLELATVSSTRVADRRQHIRGAGEGEDISIVLRPRIGVQPLQSKSTGSSG